MPDTRHVSRASTTAALCTFSCLALAALGVTSLEAATPSFDFSPCHLNGYSQELRCATLDVPEDRAHPEGRRISLRVAVAPATGSHPSPEPLVVLAGGPGQAATDYGPYLRNAFREARKGRDVVFIDQRGTGASNHLGCALDTDAWLQGLAFADSFDGTACLTGLDADPRFYTSVDAMRDLDVVRQALGVERLHLWGGSYGTRAALTYLRLFPNRVATLVLDGVVPAEHRYPLFTAADGQRALDLLIARCAADSGCAAAFPHFGEELRGLLEELGEHPAEVELSHPSRGTPVRLRVTAEAFASQLRGFLYVPEQTSQIPYLVHRARQGDYGPFLALAESVASWSVDTMALGMTLSVLCSEDLPRIAEHEIADATGGTFFGRIFVDDWRAACEGWPVRAPELDLDAPPPSSSARLLLLSGELDPVTPPRWGELAAERYPRSRHIVVPGAGHNVSHLACVPDLIAQALDGVDLDALDASCVERVTPPPFVLGPTGMAP